MGIFPIRSVIKVGYMKQLLGTLVPGCITMIMIGVYGHLVPALLMSNIDLFIFSGMILTVVPLILLLRG